MVRKAGHGPTRYGEVGATTEMVEEVVETTQVVERGELVETRQGMVDSVKMVYRLRGMAEGMEMVDATQEGQRRDMVDTVLVMVDGRNMVEQR